MHAHAADIWCVLALVHHDCLGRCGIPHETLANGSVLVWMNGNRNGPAFGGLRLIDMCERGCL